MSKSNSLKLEIGPVATLLNCAFALLATTQPVAFAQDKGIVTPEEAKALNQKDAQANSLALTWANKHIDVSLEAPSFTPWPGAGGSLGFYIRPSLLVEVAGSTSYGFSVPKQKETFQQHYFSLQGRVFFFENFAAMAGGAVAFWQGEETLEPIAGQTESPVLSKSFVSAGGIFAIGNIWRWESFHLGADWVGLYFPVTLIQRTFSSQGLSADEEATEAGKFKRSKPRLQPHFLKLRLGFSF